MGLRDFVGLLLPLWRVLSLLSPMLVHLRFVPMLVSWDTAFEAIASGMKSDSVFLLMAMLAFAAGVGQLASP
jgi:hypothetical protein